MRQTDIEWRYLMIRTAAIFLISLVLFSGCALNMSLAPEPKPLEEKVVEGEGRPKILLVDLDGMISFKEETGITGIVTKPSKVAFFREALLKAENDPDMAAVVLRINSPGGSVAASDTIYHEIMSFKQKKKIPVEAFIMEVGASGGYYVCLGVRQYYRKSGCYNRKHWRHRSEI